LTNPDFVLSLLDGEDHQAIDADRGQQQRAPAKAVKRMVLKSLRTVECLTTSSIDRICATGNPPLACCNVRWIAVLREYVRGPFGSPM
jgi:hypothetical protein